MLKTGTQEEKVQMFNSLKAEASSLIDSVVHIAYFMRGAIQYDDLMFRTPGERDIMNNFISDRFESEKKNPHPVY